MTYKEIYSAWLTNRKLTHPIPNENDYNDLTLRTVQGLVILGSMALSGTRVGTTLARVGIFKSFGSSLLGDASPLLPGFTFLEALFAFLTIEAAIFLAGYLMGDDTTDTKVWYWGLLYAALGTSLAANLFPMFTLLGDTWEQGALIIVSVITGLCTSIMPYIGGRVLKGTKYNAQRKYQLAMDEWQEETRQAWQRSLEYKQWRKSQKQQRSPSDTHPQDKILDTQKIAKWLAEQGEAVSLDRLGQQFGANQNILMETLQEDEQFVIAGFKVGVNGKV